MNSWNGVLLVVLVTACGGSSEPTPDVGPEVPADTAQSGTRLKLGWYEFDSGLRTWSTDIRDSKLDLLCKAVEWRDGVVRCTPEVREVFYSDAACTKPFIADGSTYAVSQPPRTCGSAPEQWFEATGEQRVSDIYSADVLGTCTKLSPSPNGGGLQGRDGVAQPTPDLVVLTYAYQGTGRIRIETLMGSDGLLLPIAPYDSNYAARCENFDNINLNTAGMSGMTSLPCQLAARATDNYADATCETPGAVVDATCPSPPIAVVGRSGPCRAYWAVGDESSAVLFRDSVNAGVHSCGQEDARDFVIRAATDRLAPVTLTRGRQVAEGRTNLIYLGDGDERIREHDIFYDRALDTDCQLNQRDRDHFDCWPLSRSTYAAFSDAACTQPLDIALIGDRDATDWPCAPRTQPKYSRDESGTLRLIGAPHVGPVYIGGVEIPCQQLTIIEATPHVLGPPITTSIITATKTFDL